MSIFAKLIKIGNDVASTWGGHCKGAEIKPDEGVVEFLCVEHDEEFLTSMAFDEIEEEYGLVI